MHNNAFTEIQEIQKYKSNESKIKIKKKERKRKRIHVPNKTLYYIQKREKVKNNEFINRTIHEVLNYKEENKNKNNYNEYTRNE
ncbi:MAG: hypothetical protein ACRC0V_06400 [Fusobacteriaceae bacterium]